MITTLDKNTALVLIDLQKGIVERKSVHSIEGILQNAATLVAAFRKSGRPIVIVTVNPMGAKWTKARVEAPTTPQSSVAQAAAKVAMSVIGYDSVAPQIKTEPADIFIKKHTWSAFFETPLHTELQKRQITQIVLAGVATSIGVEGTARAASELGYNIAFVLDAMTDMKPDAHEHSIKNIFPRIGEVGSTADIIGKL